MFGITPFRRIKEVRTKKLVYDYIDFNIGKTQIELIFEDKRKFKINVYGEVIQYYREGNDEKYHEYEGELVKVREPHADKYTLIHSLENAQNLIKYILQEQNFINDAKKPTKAVKGNPIEARIIKTESYIETTKIARVTI